MTLTHQEQKWKIITSDHVEKAVHHLMKKEKKKKKKKSGHFHVCVNESVIIEEWNEEGFVYSYAKLGVAGLSSLHVCKVQTMCERGKRQQHHCTIRGCKLPSRWPYMCCNGEPMHCIALLTFTVLRLSCLSVPISRVILFLRQKLILTAYTLWREKCTKYLMMTSRVN